MRLSVSLWLDLSPEDASWCVDVVISSDAQRRGPSMESSSYMIADELSWVKMAWTQWLVIHERRVHIGDAQRWIDVG